MKLFAGLNTQVLMCLFATAVNAGNHHIVGRGQTSRRLSASTTGGIDTGIVPIGHQFPITADDGTPLGSAGFELYQNSTMYLFYNIYGSPELLAFCSFCIRKQPSV